MYSDSSQPPSIDLPPPPRRIRRRPGSGSFIGCVHIFILPHTLIGIGALLFVIHGILVQAFGTVVPARVTNVYTTYSAKSGKPSYHVQYRYSLNNAPHQESSNVPWDDYSDLQRGSLVQVKVLPATAGFNDFLMTPSRSYWTDAGFLWIWALFWNGILSVFWWSLLVRPLINRNLVISGRPVAGRIVDKRIISGKSTTYRIKYEYQIEATYGHSEPRQAWMDVRSADFNEVREGQPVTVLYNPQNPKWSVVYNCADYMVA